MSIEAGEDQLVAAHPGVQPLGDSSDGPTTKAGRGDDFGVGRFQTQQPRDFEPARKFRDLFFGQKIAQKPPRFIGGFKRE